jgi:thiol:disulfide interchange protein DsbC
MRILPSVLPTLSALALSVISLNAFSADKTVELSLDQVRENLQHLDDSIGILQVRDSKIEGLYEVILKGQGILYATGDGTKFVYGDMYKAFDGKIESLSEDAKNIQAFEMNNNRKVALDELALEDMIIYPAEGEKKTHAYVFTDVDCGYCRKLHQEIEEINELGIEVRYLAFPRAGLGSNSYNKMVSAWCATDKLEALTDLKAKGSIATAVCDSPVAAQYTLGGKLGVNGTPAIISAEGKLLPGYLPAPKLADALGL